LYLSFHPLFLIGFVNISISQIAKTAGIGKGTVYEYFNNKEDIVFSMKRIDNSSYPLIITPSSGTIDGQSSITIDTQYISYKFVCDGTNWWIF